jgi:hypothetical protein
LSALDRPSQATAASPSLLRRHWPLLLALAFAALVYAPGLGGHFVYDDLPFIVNNQDLHVANDSFDAWMRAMLSLPEAHVGRWLGMLSFALNYRLGGPTVVPFKVTNLCIHLLNGVLLYAMLLRMLALDGCRPGAAGPRAPPGWLPLAIAATWMVLPINFTAVLYVSQRMESLCTTFVLLGLAGYFAARRRQIVEGEGIWPAAIWLAGATAAGIAVKESAAMLPLYALIADAALTRLADRDGRVSRPLLGLYAMVVGIPFAAGLAWLGSWIFGARSYSMSVGILPRLITEPRVLVDYLHWTLLPRLDQLALLHDDYLPSRGWLDPPSTVACALALAALLVLAWTMRRRAPLASVGIGWFFAGHLLTATVIPLDLVFEHRNYFPSIGVLLAVIALAGTMPLTGRLRSLAAVAGCLLAFNAAQVTARRAYDWGDGWRFALSEAEHRPLSSNAQYALAVALSTRADGMPHTQAQVDAVLLRAASLPGASIAPEATLIMVRSRNGLAIDPALWSSLIAKLDSHPPSTIDSNALDGLLQCHVEGSCKQPQLMLQASTAALGHGAPSAELLMNYSDFAWSVLDDRKLAERALRDALVARPDQARARAKLVAMLRAENRPDEAEKEMATLRAGNLFGALDPLIMRLDAARLDKSAHP